MKSRQRTIVAVIVVFLIAGSAAGVLLTLGGGGTGPTGKVQNFLIVITVKGYNDSIDHGVPENSWPIIQVASGTTVNITIVNDDHQAHGFQVAHYFDSTVETIAPGQTVNVNIVADETGSFRMYCEIFCTIHAYMQNGELLVS